MAISFPAQVNGMTADATFINSLAGAVEDHDAALEAMGADVHGTGKFIQTTGTTRATSNSTTEVAIADYQITGLVVPAGRVVEFTARINLASTAGGDIGCIRLRKDTIGGELVGEERLHLPAATYAFPRSLTFPWRSNGAATTWLLTLHRLNGSGTLTVILGHAGIFYCRDVVADSQFTIV